MSKRFGGKDIVNRASIVANRLESVPLMLDCGLPGEVQTSVDAAMDALGKIIDVVDAVQQRALIESAQQNIERQREIILRAEERIRELEAT